MFYKKILNKELELSNAQSVVEDPLPRHGKANVAMASYSDEIEETAMYEAPELEFDDKMHVDRQASPLMGTVKFQRCFDQLGLSLKARFIVTKAMFMISLRNSFQDHFF